MNKIERCCGTCIHKIGNKCFFPLPPFIRTKNGNQNNVNYHSYSGINPEFNDYCFVYSVNKVSNTLLVLSIDCNKNIKSVLRVKDNIIFSVGDILHDLSIITKIEISDIDICIYTNKQMVLFEKIQHKNYEKIT